MDPLSDVLSLLKPRSHVSAGFDAGGDWSVRFRGNIGIKCYAVVSGQCWLVVDDVPEPVHLQGGDCFLLPSGRPFRIASDPALEPVDAQAFFSRHSLGGVIRVGDGGELFLVGSRFELAGSHTSVLLSSLPPIVRIRDAADSAALRWSVERMMHELRHPQPGGHLIAEHLAHMMLVQALRLCLAEGAGVGWLYALADRQMSAAIGAMHDDPARRWTLQDLAAHAGMSRSSFAQRFKEKVGQSPMDYLTRWRMLLAGDRLENSGDPVSVIALSLGYESESAFSTAFKRVMGCSPRRHGRRRASEAAGAGQLEPAAT